MLLTSKELRQNTYRRRYFRKFVSSKTISESKALFKPFRRALHYLIRSLKSAKPRRRHIWLNGSKRETISRGSASVAARSSVKSIGHSLKKEPN